MAKTWIDRDTCIGCANCYSCCPEVYQGDEDGMAFVKLEGGMDGFVDVPEEFLDKAEEARSICPTESVKWEE